MGTDYEFERDVQYNYHKNILMTLEINKTCYSIGETIQGNLLLYPKNDSYQTQLINPYIEVKLREMHYYQYSRNEETVNKNKINRQITEEDEENIIIFSKVISLPDYNGKNISLDGLNIPFEVKIPQNVYPSCIFESSAFVRHFFSITFPFIEAKKTVVIVIKNDAHFSNNNGLLKSPTILQKEIEKHELIYVNSGSFKFKITLPKNIFIYSEEVPFIIEIESENLSFSIKGVEISLYRTIRYNEHYNHKIYRFRDNMELSRKYIYLTKGGKHLHVEDNIKLPITPDKFNPITVYSLLDNERKDYKYREKYEYIKIYPACYGGLITCNYFIKFIFDMGSWFTTNEEFIILLDFYDKFINNDNNTKTTEQTPGNNIDKSNKIKVEDNYPNESEIITPKNVGKKIEEELPNESDLNTQKENNNNKSENNDDKDGNAPPPPSSSPI